MKYSDLAVSQQCQRMSQTWLSRLETKSLKDKGPGCFVWNAVIDRPDSTGMFYKKDMLKKHFEHTQAEELINQIDEASSYGAFVVILIFEDKVCSLSLGTKDPHQTP